MLYGSYHERELSKSSFHDFSTSIPDHLCFSGVTSWLPIQSVGLFHDFVGLLDFRTIFKRYVQFYNLLLFKDLLFGSHHERELSKFISRLLHIYFGPLVLFSDPRADSTSLALPGLPIQSVLPIQLVQSVFGSLLLFPS